MVKDIIPYGRQDIQENDIEAVIEVLRSDFLTQGPVVPKFEETVKRYCDVKYAVAVNSATSALHISLLALGVGPGDLVWTSPNTFVASANAALYCGAKVDFVEIDALTYNMCPIALEEKLKHASQNGLLPKVVIPVHLTGQPCDMKTIHKLSLQYGFKLVEDASHAIGGRYYNETIGNCKFSDITVFSFHPVKIVTTAEGGMALTNNFGLYERLQLFRTHGITKDPRLMTQVPDGPWYYQQLELGYNYRMTDMQAALGISQLDRLDSFVKKRHAIAKRYKKELLNLPIILPKQMDNSYSAFHLFVIRLKKNSSVCRLNLYESLQDRGILVNIHYIPVHTQPYYKKLGFREGDFPEAEAYYRSAISLPIFPTLTEGQQGFIIQSLQELI